MTTTKTASKRLTVDQIAALLSPEDAGAIIGVSTKTLRNWRCLGIGPTTTYVGSRARYSADDIEAWVAGLNRRGA